MKGSTMLVLVLGAVVCIGFAHYKRSGHVTVEPIGRAEPLLSEVIEHQRQKWGLPKGMIEAVIDHETGGSWNPLTFNPEKESRCYRNAKTKKERQQCGSYGLMQPVCKYHAPDGKCQDLLHPIVSVVAATDGQLGPCFKKTKTVRGALRCYNGKGPKAERYASLAIKKYQIWKKRA